jgi:U3 small nucleolar RNA-associated protein 10
MYALLAMEVLARHFASHNAQCYIDCMPAVVAAAAGKGGVAASALMCAASFIRALHLQCIPFLGDLMPKLLACIQHDPASARRAGSSSSSSGSDSSGDDDMAPANARASKAEASKGDFTIMEAALTSLAVVATELPQFLSPFLPALVEALLLRHVSCTASSRTRDVLLGCVDAIARGVQHRLLVPLLSEKWPIAVANGGESVKMLSGLVAATASNLKQDELQTLLPHLLKFALVSLDLRFSVLSNEDSTIVDDGVVGGKGGSGSGLEACEDAVVSAIIAIVMKLSERRFQPLFTRLVDWGFGGISFTADGAKASPEELQRLHAQAAKDPIARLQICCRHTVMFRLVFALSSSLKAIFAPFFKLVLNRAVTALQFPLRIFPDFEASSTAPAEAAISKSKRKRSEAPIGAAAFAHMLPLRRACSAWILRALECCCRHDVAALINKERFDMYERFLCAFSPTVADFPPGCVVHSARRCRTPTGTCSCLPAHSTRPAFVSRSFITLFLFQRGRSIHAAHFNPCCPRMLCSCTCCRCRYIVAIAQLRPSHVSPFAATAF